MEIKHDQSALLVLISCLLLERTVHRLQGCRDRLRDMARTPIMMSSMSDFWTK